MPEPKILRRASFAVKNFWGWPVAEAFPLDWPVGYPRSQRRVRSSFGDWSFARARNNVFGELRLMGATGVVLSTNVPLNRDGIPTAARGRVQDPGVAVYFTYLKTQRVIACDRWDLIEDNLHAVELTIAAMRGLERWGASDMLNRVFQGFTALPAPPAEEPWWDVLQCRPDTRIEVIEAVYRRLAKESHPDLGGSASAMSRLNRAMEQAREEKRKSA